MTKLAMTEFGTIPSNRAKTFFRVETWSNGCFVADFANQADALKFAVADARAKGCRFDHKVSKCVIKGA